MVLPLNHLIVPSWCLPERVSTAILNFASRRSQQRRAQRLPCGAELLASWILAAAPQITKPPLLPLLKEGPQPWSWGTDALASQVPLSLQQWVSDGSVRHPACPKEQWASWSAQLSFSNWAEAKLALYRLSNSCQTVTTFGEEWPWQPQISYVEVKNTLNCPCPLRHCGEQVTHRAKLQLQRHRPWHVAQATAP